MKAKSPPYAAVFHWIVDSPAYVAATGDEWKVLTHLWRRHNGSNNGHIVYATSEGEKIGYSKSVTARCLAGLVELGFLKIARNSSFTLKTKEARLWIITAEPLNGKPPTKDFMRWTGPRSTPKAHRKFKTRSPQGDAQCPQGDRGIKSGIIIPQTVPPGGPSTPLLTPSRCPQGDTSNIPRGRPPLRFGDAAQAERITRHPNGRGDD